MKTRLPGKHVLIELRVFISQFNYLPDWRRIMPVTTITKPVRTSTVIVIAKSDRIFSFLIVQLNPFIAKQVSNKPSCCQDYYRFPAGMNGNYPIKTSTSSPSSGSLTWT